MDSLDIRYEETGPRGKYSIAMPDGSESRLTVMRAGPHHVIADSIFVPAPYRGQGIGKRLVEKLVADAGQSGDRITPTCWFVADEFTRRSPQWDDLLER